MYKLYIAKGLKTKDILERYHLNDEIIYDENGKPFFKDNPIFFNVSHSHGYTVLGLSDHLIGVDIQKITYKKRLISKICTDEEIKMIHDAKDFTKMWVKKESYVKMIGKGISYGLKNVDTLNLHLWHLKKYKNFYIAICLK